jgi:hypothetical protein
MNRIKGLVAISAFALLILGLPAIASAQWNGGYGGYGNGGYGNGNYGNLRSVVRNLKNRAERFEQSVDRWDDRNDDRRDDRNNRGSWGGFGNGSGGNLENLADRFKEATDDLEDSFGRGRNLNNSADEARRVLDIAAQIDQAFNNRRRGGGGGIQGQWTSMRQDLNVLANAYGYRGGRRNGGRGNNFPF